ncbi:MAG: glycoside hydrolase family 38 C-terminal domain-containing protein [Candidatus Hodarchaeales archaeon]
MEKPHEEILALVVPHTHWDREWYLPFQIFRNRLVNLVNELLTIFDHQSDYYFMLDGQTIILEDYLEIEPASKEKLINLIKSGKIDIGPLYILPDEWLVSGESLMRNYEYSLEIAKEYDIELMPIAYLPDMFGHSKDIPQIFRDVTKIKYAVLWRGVGEEISSSAFIWKSNNESKTSLFCIYMPYGYGNAANLPETIDGLRKLVVSKIKDLEPFSQVPIFLLMNGSDHLFPQPKLQDLLQKINVPDLHVKIGNLEEFIEAFQKEITDQNITLQEYVGEFRSSKRAPLLQDTYSTRMWIKIRSQKINDILIKYSEPLHSYLFQITDKYPDGAFKTAWKWFLRNQPHDSICGCSVDEVHDEMMTRFSWAEQIALNQIENFFQTLTASDSDNKNPSILVYNPSNWSGSNYISVCSLGSDSIKGLIDSEGNYYPIQSVFSRQDIIYQATVGPIILKTLIRSVQGGKVYNYHINNVKLNELDSQTLEVIVTCSDVATEFDFSKTYDELWEKVKSKRYKRYHVLATNNAGNSLGFIAPLKPFAFSQFIPVHDKKKIDDTFQLKISKQNIENKFYRLDIGKNGSLNLFDKENNILYSNINQFEDWGDKGDEYTFGRIGPRVIKYTLKKREIIQKGPIIGEYLLKYEMKIPEALSDDRKKRKGKVLIPINVTITFYRDLPRIDFKVNVINKAKDHRLRVLFPLPYSTSFTYTSTHFGFIKRNCVLPADDTGYIEKPSGIQPQKRFIRVQDENSSAALTLINQGLPEVELVNSNTLALTLIRSVGYLSRDDFEERPIHAGPFIATPGAQEQKSYEFNYSLLPHSNKKPIIWSFKQAEAATLKPWAKYSFLSEKRFNVLSPIIEIADERVLISSIRVRDGSPLITLYNLSAETLESEIVVPLKYNKIFNITLEDTLKAEFGVVGGKTNLTFDPYEIKLLKLVK